MPRRNFIAFSRIGMSESMKYPPHNVRKYPSGKYAIDFAVPGYSSNSLSVSVVGDSLIVAGDPSVDEVVVPETSGYLKNMPDILYRGFRTEPFKAEFLLQNKFDVQFVTLEHGILRVQLKRAEPKPGIQSFPIMRIRQLDLYSF